MHKALDRCVYTLPDIDTGAPDPACSAMRTVRTVGRVGAGWGEQCGKRVVHELREQCAYVMHFCEVFWVIHWHICWSNISLQIMFPVLSLISGPTLRLRSSVDLIFWM